MARVESTVTESTVKMRLRSENSFFGSTAAIAMAAEAPQMATEPLVSSASRQPRPSSRAAIRPKPMVAAMAETSSRMVLAPSPIRRSTLMRMPSSATPMRSTFLAQKSMPATQRPSSERKWKAMPSSSAISMAGAP